MKRFKLLIEGLDFFLFLSGKFVFTLGLSPLPLMVYFYIITYLIRACVKLHFSISNSLSHRFEHLTKTFPKIIGDQHEINLQKKLDYQLLYTYTNQPSRLRFS